MKVLKHITFFLTILFLFYFPKVYAEELPKVYISGDLSEMISKKDVRQVELDYQSNTLSFHAFAEVSIQGSSSLAYEKKNYKLELYQDGTYENKKKIDVGFGNQSNYVLKANWVDKTHARNIVSSRIMAKIQKQYGLFQDTPNYGLVDGFPVEIYLNDEFLGLYTWNIPKSSWMFNMDEKNKNHIVLAGEDWSDDVFFKKEASLETTNWEIEVGEKEDTTINKLNRIIRFISESTNQEFQNNFDEYLNLDALLNYYVFSEFAYLFDNMGKNMLLVTYDGRVWYPSLYDLDTSFGIDFSGTGLLDDYTKTLMTKDYANLLFKRLNANYPNQIADRYFALRKKILTKENVLDEFTSFENGIPLSTFALESERWENIPGFDIAQIDAFLTERIPALDQYMASLYTKKASASITYKKNKDGSVTATFVPSREDITVTNNQGLSTYTFNEVGTFTFEYQDALGNKKTIEAEVDFWKHIALVPFIIGVTLIVVAAIAIFILLNSNLKKHSKKVAPPEKLVLERRKNIGSKKKRKKNK